jgi:hypothetical protein
MYRDNDNAPSWRNDRTKFTFAICPHCEGHGQVDHPAFSNGITSDEWHGPDWDDESRENYLSGAYDVPCPDCEGGRVRVPIMGRLTFSEKRELVRERLAAQWAAESRWEQERESRMLGEW